MKFKKRTLLITGLLAASLVLLLGGSCVGTGVTAQGWSGVAGVGTRLFYIATVPGGSGGFLGCGASPAKSQVVILSSSDGGVVNTLDLGDSTISYGTPAVSGDFAYITGYNGKIYKVNVVSGGTPTGVFLNPDRPQSVIGGAAVADGRVYAASVDGKLYAMDAGTLEKRWEFATGDKIWSTPVVAAGTVYIGSFDEKVYAVDAATGQEKWSFATGGAVVATPVVAGGRVYVASLDRSVYALDAATGSLVWRFPAADAGVMPQRWFWATPVLVGNELYAPNTDGQLFILNAQNGSLVTTLTMSGSVASSPVIAGGKVVLVTEQGDIYTVDTTSHQFDGAAYRLRTLPATGTSNSGLMTRASLAVSNNLVYIHATNPERVFEFNPAAKEAKEIATRASAATIPPTTAPATVTVTVTTTG